MTLELNLRKGLVGHWTMDNEDTSGGTLYDRSSYDNHGEINSPSTGVSGIVSQAYSFNGISDEVIIQDESELNFGSGNFTFSCWYKGQPNDEYEMTVFKGSSTRSASADGPGWFFRGTRNNNTTEFATDDGTDVALVNAGVVVDDNWHHALTVRDAASSTLTIYIDGVQKDQTNSSVGTVSNSVNLQLGGGSGGQNWTGEVDDVRLYSRVLSQSEINQLYNMRSQRNASI